MGDTLTCKDIKKAVEILKQNQIELPYIAYLPAVYLKRREIVDYAKWGAKTRRFATYFLDKDNTIIKSFKMDKIN